MATVRTEERETTTFTVTTNGTPATSSRSTVVDVKLEDSGEHGQFVNLSDGTRFRKATNLRKLHCSVSPKSPFKAGGKTKYGNYPLQVNSSSGGYAFDTMFSSAFPDFTGVDGSVNKLDGYPFAPQMMKNEANTKALLDLADAKANIGETLATMRQTGAMLAAPLGNLNNSLRSAWHDIRLRQFFRKSPRQLRQGPLQTGAQRYIEYVYGWKPLMADIFGIIELMKEQGVNPLLFSGYGVSRQAGVTRERALVHTSYKNTVTVKPLDERRTVRTKIWGRIDPASAGLRALNQLGLLNPASLAWDVMSWSFVVDWVVPIGSTLQALTAPAGLHFVDGSTSVKTTLSGHYTEDLRGYSNHDSGWSSSLAEGSVKYKGYSRTRLTSWPVPGFFIDQTPLRGDRPFKALALSVTNLRGLRI